MTDDRREAVRRMFDAVADRYDTSGVPFFVPIARLLVDDLAPAPGERALDVGCGRGAALLQLAQRLGPAGRTVGIDLSERMVEHARGAADVLGVDVDVRVGDAQSPDLPPASFDIVAASLVVFFLPDPALALQRWHDLLVPGGRVGFTTFGDYSAEWKPVSAVFEPYLQSSMLLRAQRDVESPFSSTERVDELVRGAGFEQVRSVIHVLPVEFDSPQQWEEWMRSTGQAAWWRAVPEAETDRVRAAAYAAIERCRNADGMYRFDQEIRTTVGIRGR